MLDDLLQAHPEWPTPEVADGGVVTHGNPVAEWLYRSDALSEWRTELVPSAIALYPVQRQHEHLPSGAAHDETTTLVLRHSLDAAGIRTRAMVMSDAVGLAEARCASEPEPGLWVSLACGAAVPVLDARADLGSSAHVVLVDVDPQALAFAGQLAERAGLVRDQDFTVLHRDLVRSLVVHDDLITEIGEQRAAVVDALGIFEYFSDASAVRLLRNAYRLVRPGGSLVVGNMLADRPQLAFNQRGAGWPGLHVRSVEQLAGLVQRAGLPLDRTTISIPQDGVYAVVDVVR
ncbi:MAG: class I SAM-dependent methyltransferase [Quadrisphaera sp.]